MGLTDDIYIKMNSRGKPLTQFEHFKAEYERTLNELDKDYSKSIIQKIDHQWTDLLWPYKDEGNIIDNSFLRYFRFICDIICYKGGGRPTVSDEFELIKLYFTGEDSLDNAFTIEKYFDCWFKIQGMSIGDFFSSFISYSHEIGKIKIDQRYNINLFEDCINNYGETISYSIRNRKFPLPRLILLYAFITYLLNNDSVSKEQFSERVRHVHNLILNSSEEISDSESRVGGNRLPAMLKQVDSIILQGKVDLEEQNNFNVNQLKEEAEKVEWLKTHSDSAETLYTLEDHKLLHGQIGIVGLENINYASRFESLFNCDVDLIDCALLTLGSYCRQESNYWRWQFGAKNDSSWDLIFHKNSAKNFDQTKEILYNLLSQKEIFTNDYLLSLKDNYINKCEAEEKFDWRYYRLKYKSFRDSNFGKYCFDDFYNEPYNCMLMKTAQKPSSSSYIPFLYEIDPNRVSSVHYGKRLQYDNFYVRIRNSSLIFKSNAENGASDEILKEISIPQENGIDIVNRIEFCKEELAKFIAGRSEFQPQ